MDFSSARVFDLSQPYFLGMPHHPAHPPFCFSLTKLHGDFCDPSGMSSAADAVAMSGHTGTHIDALCHFSKDGKLHGGEKVRQSWATGVEVLSIATVAPIVRRGVLLDIAGLEGAEALAADFEIKPEHLERAAETQKVSIHAGDVVLLRTGWAQFWRDSRRYINEVKCPGPAIAGARWLSAKKPFATGADTIAFERVPDPAMPVHVHMLVESGIHLVENLNLEELARERVYEFEFVAAPLRIEGGTGAPVRPLAIL